MKVRVFVKGIVTENLDVRRRGGPPREYTRGPSRAEIVTTFESYPALVYEGQTELTQAETEKLHALYAEIEQRVTKEHEG